MAVSNALGSNTFNIFICLGLPWLIYTLVTQDALIVDTDGLTTSIALLLASIVVVMVVVAASNFRLRVWHGVLFTAMYTAFFLYQVGIGLVRW